MAVSPFSSATAMLSALRERGISSVELLEEQIRRIDRHDPALNAIVIRDYDAARRAAAAADAARARGEDAPLLGLPYTVKDWIEVAGLRSTAGDPSLEGYRAKADSRVVARLRAAGGVLFAKTNMATWGGDWQTANAVFGRSNNPWDLERTPGGSTGGGAAALATGLTPLEFGNDIGGSVRIPPAFCGVYGHKPSETALPRTGQTPDQSGRHLPNPATSMAVIGPLARAAEDLELALEVTAGPDQGEDVAWRQAIPGPRRERLDGYRVAVLPRVPWLPVSDEILAAQERLASGLARLGAKVGEAQPEGFADLRRHHATYHTLLAVQMTLGFPVERRREMAEWGHAEAKVRGDEFLEAGARAMELSAADYIGLYHERERYRAAYRAFFREWDVLLTPTTFASAFRHDETPPEVTPDDRTLLVNGKRVAYGLLGVFAGLATLSGQPATAFPFGLSGRGLPVGLQAIGPYLEDRTPIRFAGLVAREFGGFQAPPGYDDAW